MTPERLSHPLTSTPTITLVTVTYNAATVLQDFWNSLQNQNGVDWHLVVVDNASVDATREKLAELELDDRVTIILSEINTGAAEGNNIGLRQAMLGSSEYFVLCNNDITFEPDVLRHLASSKKSLGVGAVAPVMMFDGGNAKPWFERGRFAFAFGIRCLHVRSDLNEPKGLPYSTAYAPTTFLIFDRVVMETVGELDRAYFAYWEDADYAWRVRKAGFGMWVDPAVNIIHKVSQSSGGFQSTYSIRQYYQNQVRFSFKHFGFWLCSYTVVMSVVRIMVSFLIGLNTKEQSTAKLSGLWAGFAELRAGHRNTLG